MRFPSHLETIFSLKAFTAAMLALYVSFSAGLQNPGWAITTVYVVSQPYTGAILSKAMFRLAGTLTGAVVAIIIAALLGSNELLRMLALTVWMCLCVYIALLDRTPKNYFFLLAGITGALVAWPGGLVSGPVFSVAVSRLEEISLGIVCVVLVDKVFFPQSVLPVIDTNFRQWLDEVRDWSLDIMQPVTSKVKPVHEARRMAADASTLDTLITHLNFEASDARARVPWVRLLQRRMLLLLPILSSIDDRMIELRRFHGDLPNHLIALLSEVRSWVESTQVKTTHSKQPQLSSSAIESRITALEPDPKTSTSWEDLLLIGLLERLKMFTTEWSRCQELEAILREQQLSPTRRLKALARQTISVPHVDHGKAFWSLAAGLIAASITGTFWYFTGWSNGGAATLLSLMSCLFLGALDDPVPMLRLFAKVTAVATIANGIYLFAILPSLHSFPLVVIALGLVFIPLGVLAFNPANLLIVVLPIAFMSLQSTTSANFPSFVNGMIAVVVGVFVAMVVTKIVRSMGAELSARRILFAGRRDLRQMALGTRQLDRNVFLSRMLDRLGLLSPRLQAVEPEAAIANVNILSEIRLGLNISELQRRINDLPDATQRAIHTLMNTLAGHLHVHQPHDANPPAALLEQIDHALKQVAGHSIQHSRTIILALVGVRRSLFPNAESPLPTHFIQGDP